MKTVVVNTKEIKRKWYLIDASGVVLGRLASNVATMLIGKRKPAFSPNQDHGDNVVIINASKVKLTGNKPQTKTYFRHSTQPGGGKAVPFAKQLRIDPRRIIVHAVHGMVPKKSLGRAMMKKLHVYEGDTHPHSAQKPETVSLNK